MKYYPRLKMFKNSSGTNTFDGHEARSYDWYVYAYVINGKVWKVEKAYSSTTAGHMADFATLAGYDAIRIMAPRGLNNLDDARLAISREIAELREQLLNKRNRNKEARQDRIDALEKMLLNIVELENALNNYTKVA
jgi:hypothetical protein